MHWISGRSDSDPAQVACGSGASRKQISCSLAACMMQVWWRSSAGQVVIRQAGWIMWLVLIAAMIKLKLSEVSLSRGEVRDPLALLPGAQCNQMHQPNGTRAGHCHSLGLHYSDLSTLQKQQHEKEQLLRCLKHGHWSSCTMIRLCLVPWIRHYERISEAICQHHNYTLAQSARDPVLAAL